MIERNYGILTSIDWNSNTWKSVPTEEDLRNANYAYVKEHGYTHTCLNFGHEEYPTDDEGYYYGLLPQLWSRSPDSNKARYIEVVFIKSYNYRDNQNYIIGLYSFPEFTKCKRPSPIPEFPREFELNVKARPKDIHLLDNYVNLSSNPDFKKFLPEGKELGKQGYNYLAKANVYSILDAMTKLNPDDRKLSGIKLRLITTIDKIN